MTLFPITINVLSDGDPLEAVAISIWNETVLDHVVSTSTNASGQALVGLANGTYTLFLSKAGYNGVLSYYTFIVADSADTLEYTLYTTAEVTLPAGKVLLYGFVKDIAGSPILNAKVICRLSQNDQSTTTTIFDKHDITTYSGIDGYYHFILDAGLKVTLVCATGNFMLTGILPLSGKVTGPELDQVA